MTDARARRTEQERAERVDRKARILTAEAHLRDGKVLVATGGVISLACLICAGALHGGFLCLLLLILPLQVRYVRAAIELRETIADCRKAWGV